MSKDDLSQAAYTLREIVFYITSVPLKVLHFALVLLGLVQC